MALLVSGVQVELREIMLRDKPQAMLDASAKGTVPVLVLADGHVIDESLDIMIWALGRQDPDEWLLGDAEQTNALIKQNDTDFKYALDRYKYPNRYEGEDCRYMFERGAQILSQWNGRIAKSGFLVEEYGTLADYAIFPFVRQFRNTDTDRFVSLRFKALNRWLENNLHSDLFIRSMVKHEPWQRGDRPILLR